MAERSVVVSVPLRAPLPRHVLVGDLNYLEYAIADYIVRWGQHLDGVEGDSIAGTPVAVANMAMTVIRKNLQPAEPVHVPWFARLRDRLSRRRDGDHSGRTDVSAQVSEQ